MTGRTQVLELAVLAAKGYDSAHGKKTLLSTDGTIALYSNITL